jgi:hypothetical protein
MRRLSWAMTSGPVWLLGLATDWGWA